MKRQHKSLGTTSGPSHEDGTLSDHLGDGVQAEWTNEILRGEPPSIPVIGLFIGAWTFVRRRVRRRAK